MGKIWKRSYTVWTIVVLLVLGISMVRFSMSVAKTDLSNQLALSGEVILLDPGHGGVDGGAVSKSGLVEKEVTLKIALFLRDYLQQSGAYVILTREDDYDLSQEGTTKLSKKKAEDLMKRVHMIKEKQANTVISIHLNAFPQKQYTGAQTFYYPKRKENQRLASCIQQELIKNLQNTERIPKQKADVYLLKESPVATALVEVGFLSNPQEAQLLADEAYQQKIAASIYYGIMKYYSKEKEPQFPK